MCVIIALRRRSTAISCKSCLADASQQESEHQSRISKLAFWRHHKNNDKIAKTVQAKQAQPKPAQVKAAQTKPVPAKLAVGKKGGKQEQHAKSKARAHKTSSAIKTKPQEKAQDHSTASLKQ